MHLHRNSQTKIAQLTLEHANTVHSLRAVTTQDTQTVITLTQLVADLREVGAEVSELQHDLTPTDPLPAPRTAALPHLHTTTEPPSNIYSALSLPSVDPHAKITANTGAEYFTHQHVWVPIPPAITTCMACMWS